MKYIFNCLAGNQHTIFEKNGVHRSLPQTILMDEYEIISKAQSTESINISQPQSICNFCLNAMLLDPLNDYSFRRKKMPLILA